ncbi:MAG: hypothetical protein HUU01_08155 [Saprospiraceae bacterium]|nr:hypothetical protein [Saprospiraceae bacterium]
MDIKKIFGVILTLLGISSLIYTAILFNNTSGGVRDVKSLVIYGILGIMFFSAGIGLVRTIKEAS